ncbi:MAG: rhomboid family intramembrane serine protease [Terriglobales bacterium]
MSRGQTISFSFPPFTGWVKRIILTCTGIYLFQVVVPLFSRSAVALMREWFALIPIDVMYGQVWQLVTYSLLHAGFSHLFFNMLTLWFIGAYLERDWGSRRFIECYIFCVVGAALVTIAVSYTHFLGMDPRTGTVGASGGIFGLLMAFGILYADQEMYLFPLPFRIKAKYLVGIWVVVAIIAVFEPTGEVAVFAHLGGLFFGFLWVKFMPSRGMGYAASERYFGVRNSYYRWKRRRAARKFEVYMRDHDSKVTFDEHGNYVPPDDNDKPNGGSKSGWVN